MQSRILLTTKDPFTGTETIQYPFYQRHLIINNEGPLYGDGNLTDPLTLGEQKLQINNEGPLYGDGNHWKPFEPQP